MPKVTFQFEDDREDVTVDVNLGSTVLDAAEDNDIKIPHKCGGNCSCTTCHCLVINGECSNISVDESDMLEDLEETRTKISRLACQCQIMGDMVIKVPKST